MAGLYYSSVAIEKAEAPSRSVRADQPLEKPKAGTIAETAHTDEQRGLHISSTTRIEFKSWRIPTSTELEKKKQVSKASETKARSYALISTNLRIQLNRERKEIERLKASNLKLSEKPDAVSKYIKTISGKDKDCSHGGVLRRAQWYSK